MGKKQTFDVKCTGHTFELELEEEDLELMRNLGRGSLHGVNCRRCSKTYRIPHQSLADCLTAEEDALLVEEITAERGKQRGKKKVEEVGKSELNRRVREKLRRRKPLIMEAVECDCSSTWDTSKSEKGFSGRE